jgi:hypothetical protein
MSQQRPSVISEQDRVILFDGVCAEVLKVLKFYEEHLLRMFNG